MQKLTHKFVLIGLILTFLFINKSMAHHGVNGQFDVSKTIEVTGIITKSKLVNPHAYIYFDVKNNTGSFDNWRCDLGTGSVLKRAGWTSKTFAKGKQITVVGAPARNEDFACHISSIRFADGTTITRNSIFDDEGNLVKEPRQTLLSDGTPNIAGSWVSEKPKRGARPPKPPTERPEAQAGEDSTAATDRPPKGQRPPRDDNRAKFVLTEAGKKAIEGYSIDDTPRFHCSATNIIDDWTFDQIVNKIEQTHDDIIIHYGFMDIVRTIHLDLDHHPDDIQPSITGHSIGKWEDGVLVVDTVGFSPGYIHAPPFPRGAAKNSEQLHIIEHFYLSADGLSLHRKYEGEDPLYLSEKFSGEDVVKLTDAQYSPYNCDDLTYEKR
jgi:hypothetical protein